MKPYRIVVLSSLFPSSVRKNAGLFIRERMFRVARHCELRVVSPVPWFPGQGLIRLFKKDYRPMPAKMEVQDGINVYYPRFLSFPGILRSLDAQSMALSCYFLLKRLKKEFDFDLIDSHFTYPDGLAATQLAKKFNCKTTITLRGTEVPHSKDPQRREKLLEAWREADRMFPVSDSLRQCALSAGADAKKFTVIGNGIDSDKFQPVERTQARASLGLAEDGKVLITVGGLVERKGFHRVIACLPELLKQYPKLTYLIVGGASAEGNYEPQLRALVKQLKLEDAVKFLGPLRPDQLSVPLSAADAFVLATSNEGWANVILEAMACGTPVIATDVGGNAEVVTSTELGEIIPFGDHQALMDALNNALAKPWNKEQIIQYARDNHWDKRIALILSEYDALLKTE